MQKSLRNEQKTSKSVLVSLHRSFRKILRLVKHTLVSVSGVRDQEMALLDEMLAASAREASNKSLELIFSSHLFYQNRQERFISSLAGTVFREERGHIHTRQCLEIYSSR